MMEICENLIRYVSENLLNKSVITYQNKKINIKNKFDKFSMIEVVLRDCFMAPVALKGTLTYMM